jgi:hypothetical protein
MSNCLEPYANTLIYVNFFKSDSRASKLKQDGAINWDNRHDVHEGCGFDAICSVTTTPIVPSGDGYSSGEGDKGDAT